MLVKFRPIDPDLGKVRISDKIVALGQLTDETVERNWDRLKAFFERVPAQAAKPPKPEPGNPSGRD